MLALQPAEALLGFQRAAVHTQRPEMLLLGQVEEGRVLCDGCVIKTC